MSPPAGGIAVKKGTTAGDLAPLAAILIAYLLLAGYYLSQPGLAWDEAMYVPYAEVYRQWFAGLPGTLNAHDIYNALGRYTSHPPLTGYVIALATSIFGNSMGLLYAARVASVAAMAALVAAVYIFTLRAKGVVAATAAGVFLIFMPWAFALSILATQDALMIFTWFAAAALFYAAMERRGLAWAAGVAAGLAMLTKINALALPLVLWPWGLYFYGRRAWPAIIWMAVAMPAMLFALWPFLWWEPGVALGKYFGEKFPFVVSAYGAAGIDLRASGDALHKSLVRTEVSVLYFGKVYSRAPWHYAAVMTAITTPVFTLAAAVLGAGGLLRTERPRRFVSFVAWNIVFWLAVFSCGAARPYDGVRLFAVILPFVAVLSGVGVQFVWERFSRAKSDAWRGRIFAALLIAPTMVSFAVIEPWGLSYYNILAGGLPGAARAGMPVTYWGECADDEISSYVNREAGEGARVAAFPMGILYVENMRYFGLLRADIKQVMAEDDWDYLIVANRGDALAAREDLRGLTKSAVVTKKIRGVEAAWLVEKKR